MTGALISARALDLASAAVMTTAVPSVLLAVQSLRATRTKNVLVPSGCAL